MRRRSPEWQDFDIAPRRQHETARRLQPTPRLMAAVDTGGPDAIWSRRLSAPGQLGPFVVRCIDEIGPVTHHRYRAASTTSIPSRPYVRNKTLRRRKRLAV